MPAGAGWGTGGWPMSSLAPFTAVPAAPGVLPDALVLCDHAGRAIPEPYGDLGLPPSVFERHIAYDIGAAGVTRVLAAELGAPALLANFSRLLIDSNRGPDDPTLVMRLSDGAIVPGNARVDEAEIARRKADWWQPYQGAISSEIDAMIASGKPPVLVSIHSFTPAWKGVPRPWHVGILWDRDDRLAAPLRRLREWMEHQHATLVAAILLVIGIMVLYKGLHGL